MSLRNGCQHSLFIMMLAIGGTLAYAQEENQEDASDSQSTRVKVTFEQILPVQQLLGTPVADPQGEMLGLVRDVLVNLHTGDAPAAVVSTDGTTTQPMRVLPLTAGTIEDFGTQERLAWRLTGDEASALQQTELNAAETSYSTEQLQQWLAKYGRLERKSDSVTENTAGELVSLRGLFWQQIRNKDNEPAGVISDFVLDLEKSRLAYTILSLGGTDAQQREGDPSARAAELEAAPRIVVPLAAYVQSPEERTWKLELPQSEIDAYLPIEKNEWPREITRSWIEYVSVRYGSDVSGGLQRKSHEEQSRPEK